MPLIIATLVLAVGLGLWAPRRVALAVTAAAAAFTVVSFVWSVADGNGDDPWWLILLAVAGGTLAVAVAAALSRVRSLQRAEG